MGTRKPRCPLCGPYHSERRHTLLTQAYEEDSPITGTTLLALRLKEGMRRRDLACAIGYTARAVKAWELGTRRVPADVWPVVLNALSAVQDARERHQERLRRWRRGSDWFAE